MPRLQQFAVTLPGFKWFAETLPRYKWFIWMTTHLKWLAEKMRQPKQLTLLISIVLHAIFILTGEDWAQARATSGPISVRVAMIDQPSVEEISPPEPVVEEVPPPIPVETVAPKKSPTPKKPVAKATSKKTQPRPPPTQSVRSAESSTRTSADSAERQSRGVLPIARPDFLAIPLYHLIPKPPYPSRSRDLGEHGIVMVAVLVGEDGRVVEARLANSSGYHLLDGSALSTVRQKWRFRPARKGGKPVATWVRVPIRFLIN